MFQETSRTRKLALIALGSAVVLAACGGGGSKSLPKSSPPTSFSLPSFSLPTGSTTGNNSGFEPTGPPTGKIRIANFFAPNGKPGPALDFYDTSRPGANDPTLISNLAYGQVSEYVTPRAPAGDKYSNLYIFPAGSKTHGTQFIGMQSGSNISNAGWVAGQQVTYVMGTNDQGISGQPNPTFQEINEVPYGTDSPATFATAPAGKGVLATNIEGFPPGTQPNPYVRVDGKCPPITDPLSTTPTTESNDSTSPGLLGNFNASSFVLAPGSHALDFVLSADKGSGLDQAQCRAAKAVVSTTATVPAGGPVLVFLYGPTIDDLRTLTATVG